MLSDGYLLELTASPTANHLHCTTENRWDVITSSSGAVKHRPPPLQGQVVTQHHRHRELPCCPTPVPLVSRFHLFSITLPPHVQHLLCLCHTTVTTRQHWLSHLPHHPRVTAGLGLSPRPQACANCCKLALVTDQNHRIMERFGLEGTLKTI